jgi:NTP pyrophosphatase (non-canonical NTP hydrolase)
MNIKEFQELSKRTMPEITNIEDRNQALVNYALGLAGETGEVVDLIKKYVYHGHPMTLELKHKIMLEIGDDFHYLVGLCTLFDIDPQLAMDMNINKLKKRYPEGFSTKRSINRND